MLKTLKKLIRRLLWFLLIVLTTGLLIPQRIQMPLSGAGNSDFNHQSFWYYPWGRSGTHKGVDIFAKKGTPIKSATSGLVVFSGQNEMGGNIAVVLGPKWRFHYYAHMREVTASRFDWVTKSDNIGTVGDSGNAKGKPPHLHYTISTFLPHFWLWDGSPQGWKKMFFINPIPYIRG